MDDDETEIIFYSDNPQRAAEGFHKASTCPCPHCVEFRWIMSPEGSAQIRERAIQEIIRHMDGE